MMKHRRVGGPSSRTDLVSQLSPRVTCATPTTAPLVIPARTDSGGGGSGGGRVTAASKWRPRADQAFCSRLWPPRLHVERRDRWFRVRSITLDVCGAAQIWCISPLCPLLKSCGCTFYKSHFNKDVFKINDYLNLKGQFTSSYIIHRFLDYHFLFLLIDVLFVCFW